MKRLLKYIFIPIFAVLLMSHNVFAVDMSPNVHPIWTNYGGLCSFYNGASNTWINNSFSNNSNTQDVTYSIGKINCDYPAGIETYGTYAVYSFRIDNYNYNDSADSGFLRVLSRAVTGSAAYGVIGATVSSMGSTGYQIDIYLFSEGNSNKTAGTFQLYNPQNADEIFYLKPKERVSYIGASFWATTTPSDFEYNYTDAIAAINSHLATIEARANSINSYVYYIREGVNSINTKLEDMAQDTADAVNDGQAQATQDASDNSSTSANNNSSNQTTSNLLGVFGSFVTALTSISPSNCNVDFDLGHIDFGVQNLCSQPVPQAFTVVTSIIVVCFTIPFVVHLVKRILSLIREMQS